MTPDDHLVGLGKVVGNLHALEHVVRVFLCEASSEKLEYPDVSTSTVAETPLTNYLPLGKMIDKYNDALQVAEQNYRIDPSVVGIRDTIAHGRIVTAIKKFPVTLIKFGKKNQEGRIPVEGMEELSEGWFSEKRTLLRQQIDAVLGCAKSRSYKTI